MSGATESSAGSCPKDDSCSVPPPLSLKLPELSDLPQKCKRWSDVQLPVDILLLTVEDCEFLACLAYTKNSFKCYHIDLGFVYFGKMGDDEDEPLTIALMKCNEGSSGPGGSQTVVKNAVMQLRPKAIYSVGCCVGLNEDKTQLGDVVVSSKLAFETFRAPVGKGIGNVVKHAADGWKPPIESPGARKVNVHCDGEILSGTDQNTAEQVQEMHPNAVAIEMEGKGEI